MLNVEPSFVLYALLLEPGGCLRARITLFELVEPGQKKMETPNWTLVFGGYGVKQDCPCGLGAALQAYIKFRPLLAQHPAHRSECPYFWIGLKMKMPMSTPLCITLLLCLKSVVLLPRKALWCVSLCNSVISFDLTEISGSFSVGQTAVAKRWGGVGHLVTFVGTAVVDAMAAMEKRGLHPALGTFKEVEGIMPDRLREIIIKDVKQA